MARSYFFDQMKTLEASPWRLMMARLFGKKEVLRTWDTGKQALLVTYRYKDKVYITKYVEGIWL